MSDGRLYRKVELRVSATRTVATTQNVIAFIEGSVEPGNVTADLDCILT